MKPTEYREAGARWPSFEVYNRICKLFGWPQAFVPRRWRAAQAAEHLTFGPAWRDDGGLGIVATWVVTEPDGAVINPETLLGRWRSAVKMAGVPAIPLHGARHSYAETALHAGARLDVVSRQLGHASIATTANTYLHGADASAIEAADLLAKVLDAAGGGIPVESSPEAKRGCRSPDTPV